jgi:hypothetical protein
MAMQTQLFAIATNGVRLGVDTDILARMAYFRPVHLLSTEQAREFLGFLQAQPSPQPYDWSRDVLG